MDLQSDQFFKGVARKNLPMRAHFWTYTNLKALTVILTNSLFVLD
jgi:hypothetical protein